MGPGGKFEAQEESHESHMAASHAPPIHSRDWFTGFVGVCIRN